MGASPLVSIKINVLHRSTVSIQYFRGGASFFLAGEIYKLKRFYEQDHTAVNWKFIAEEISCKNKNIRNKRS